MKNFLKILILPIAILTMLGGFAPNAFAAPLEVTFVPDPLFNKTNFLPLDETSGVVTVTNNSGATQNILTEAINVLDTDNFGSLLHLKIVGGTLFDDSLADFFSTAGEVSLGAISNGESKIFTYTISFIDSNNNSYQGKTLGFDVCVGFEGGATHCGDTVVGGENDTGGGGGGGGGGSSGGGGGGPIILTILNEQTSSIEDVDGFPPTATATIIWDTNVLSTSQVVYGPTPPTYTLDMSALYFGYPFGTTEDPTKVLHHSVLLTGLIPGQTYAYRVVSRASPPTISFEKYFTVPLLAQAGNNNFTGGNPSASTNGFGTGSASSATAGGVGQGAGSGNSVLLAEENVVNPNNNLTANPLLSGFENILSLCSLIGLLILLIFYIIWRLWLQKKYEKSGILEEEIWNRFYLFFGSSSVLATLVSFDLDEYCILPVFIIAIVICLCLYAYKKFGK